MQPSTVTGKRGRHAALRSRLLLVAAIASGLLLYGSANAQEAAGRSELILSNLPPKGSKAYKDLLGRAGKDANGQVLGLTQSEVWSMPTSRIDDVIRHGETLGVKMTKLGADYDFERVSGEAFRVLFEGYRKK